MLEPSGLGVAIDTPLEPPKIMLDAQRIRRFDDRTAYGKWHMGPGMVVVVPESEADTVLAHAAASGIDADRIGMIDDKPGIQIRNRGIQQHNEWLEF